MRTDFSDANEWVKLFYDELDADKGLDENLKARFMESYGLELLGIKKLLNVFEGVYFNTDNEKITQNNIEVGIIANLDEEITNITNLHSYIFSKVQERTDLTVPKQIPSGFELYLGKGIQEELVLAAIFSRPDQNKMIRFDREIGFGNCIATALKKRYEVDKVVALYDSSITRASKSITIPNAEKILNCYTGEFIR